MGRNRQAKGLPRRQGAHHRTESVGEGAAQARHVCGLTATHPACPAGKGHITGQEVSARVPPKPATCAA